MDETGEEARSTMSGYYEPEPDYEVESYTNRIRASSHVIVKSSIFKYI